MKIVLLMVQSLNGKITRGDNPDIYSWTSKEDQEFFFDFLSKHNLIVMGRSTYEAAKENIKPDGKKRRIILTSKPVTYKTEEIKGEIEFSSEHPRELVERVSKEGYQEMLLVGGGKTNTAFFEAGLVTEMYITIEPRLFGRGKSVIADGKFDTRLKLVDLKKLNAKGTLLVHYIVSSQ